MILSNSATISCKYIRVKSSWVNYKTSIFKFCSSRDIELTTTIENNAPEPMLKVAVKQGNSLVNGELNVKPGTPLTMEIYLDKESAPIYGLLVSFMRVSDTKSQEETIIYNG